MADDDYDALEKLALEMIEEVEKARVRYDLFLTDVPSYGELVVTLRKMYDNFTAERRGGLGDHSKNEPQ